MGTPKMGLGVPRGVLSPPGRGCGVMGTPKNGENGEKLGLKNGGLGFLGLGSQGGPSGLGDSLAPPSQVSPISPQEEEKSVRHRPSLAGTPPTPPTDPDGF